MDYTNWEPFYQIILNRFGFSEKSDIKTAEWFSDVLTALHFSEKTEDDSIKELKNKIAGKNIVVCGNAPSLNDEYLQFQNQKNTTGDEIYIAADGAASVLLKNRKVPDIIVTDLDGKHQNDAIKEIEATDKGALLLIHAHGDNLDKLEKYLPAFSDKIKENAVVPTCQCRPPKKLHNFGGFTDGDRCVFLADEFGAASVTLIGFDFNDPDVSPMKKKKLQCAEKLIQMIREQNSKIRFFSEI
ncbi:hypothetical protein MmiEs2_06730 [Methanimicrococcus stummii]|uniref:6-hydroxymethyl-7,8-dihydropterin pyrophosphokinase n=1 Tax=Methanimicrococcus stummii TaxID=3028294 RepID=A0AA96VA49_9EURY|nr:6-hydroxymethylpterin diphosphokinase MptE-like protein [Methanimicrococcus sp. Es2]WNY28485.1 hypothetical protein MmiEs2_06730 [Methanimicrococcus sp. Es2]